MPEDFDYESRAFQYQQSAKKLTGRLQFTLPNGEAVKEKVDPKDSILFMVHESNPPEAIPTGIGLAVSTQLNLRYLQGYNLQWPWELIYADLGNGAQLQFDLQSYHDTTRGLIKLSPKQPTYRVLATLRLPNGKNVVLDDSLRAEHLERRTLDSIASAAGNAVSSVWTQGWKFRVSYPGGKVPGPDGKMVKVPPFDLGLAPPFTKAEPLPDEQNFRLTQRVPFDVTGSYAGCPVDGFAWSELLTNWYMWEDQDPWFTERPDAEDPEALRGEDPADPHGPARRHGPAARGHRAPEPERRGLRHPRLEAALRVHRQGGRWHRRDGRPERMDGHDQPGRPRRADPDRRPRRLSVLPVPDDRGGRPRGARGEARLDGRRRQPGHLLLAPEIALNRE